MIKVEKLNVMQYIPENCYIVINTDTSECFIVDPGAEKEKIQDFIVKGKLKVVAILLTHGHLDHMNACDCYDVPVYIHEDEVNLLNNDSINCAQLLHAKVEYDRSKLNIITVKDNDKIDLIGTEIKVLHTKGHTSGSVSYLVDNNLFSGDTLFYCSVGRSDLPTGSQDELIKSLQYIMDTLDDKIVVYPGHGDSTTIGFERKHNSFYLNTK